MIDLSEITKLIENEDVRDFLNKNVEIVWEELKDRSKIVFTKEHLKMAWNYEEKNTKKYSFTQAIDWIKMNMPDGIREAAIYKDEKTNVINLHLCYILNDEPILNGNYPHLVVNTIELDNEFLDNFGDKNLIVLK